MNPIIMCSIMICNEEFLTFAGILLVTIAVAGVGFYLYLGIKRLLSFHKFKNKDQL